MDEIIIQTVVVRSGNQTTPSRKMPCDKARAEKILNKSRGWELPQNSEWEMSNGVLVKKPKPVKEPAQKSKEKPAEASEKAESPAPKSKIATKKKAKAVKENTDQKDTTDSK